MPSGNGNVPWSRDVLKDAGCSWWRLVSSSSTSSILVRNLSPRNVSRSGVLNESVVESGVVIAPVLGWSSLNVVVTCRG